MFFRKRIDCLFRFTTANGNSVDSIMSRHLLCGDSEISSSNASSGFTVSSLNGSSVKRL